jgi:hypothetical protein
MRTKSSRHGLLLIVAHYIVTAATWAMGGVGLNLADARGRRVGQYHTWNRSRRVAPATPELSEGKQ